MMAGLDGIQNKIHPGDPASKNLYDLPPEEDAQIRITSYNVCYTKLLRVAQHVDAANKSEAAVDHHQLPV